MIKRIIAWCAGNPIAVIAIFALALAASWVSMKKLPLDAIPDLSETQVILFTEWMGRSPDLMEDQVTYPIVSRMISAPRVKYVRGYSMFGMSFVYVVFDDGTDPYWARSRVSEYLPSIAAKLPPGTSPVLGPDATSLGWVFQYALVDRSGEHDLADLRSYQDFNLRYALESVPGVAEVASLGGFEKQFQVSLDPQALLAHGVTLDEVVAAVRSSSGDAGGGILEMSSREYYVRGKGYVKTLEELENVAVRGSAGGTPVLVKDLGRAGFGGDTRRGISDLGGEGEAVGGIVVMRHGENALDVIRRVKSRIEEIRPSLPRGVEIVTTYDRSGLISRAIETLTGTLLEEGVVVALVILVFLLHVRSSLVPILTLPVAVLLAFIPMRLLGVTSNIMSLGGIAIAIGAMVDASIVIVENAHKRLERAGPGSDRNAILVESAQEVGPAIFFSLLVITVAFLPVFALTGQAGKLFHPLAYTKTFAMFFSAVVAVTLSPVLMRWLVRGRIFSEARHPVSRLLIGVYEPFVWVALKRPMTTVLIGAFAVASAVPVAARLGSEFMPPLEEGDVLYMPTTFPNISIEEARRSLQAQDAILASMPEVETVQGKAGRADTATDPAPLSMIETVVKLKPKEAWRKVRVERFWSGWAPGFALPVLRRIWPDERTITMQELVAAMDEAMDIPGWTDAWTMPIKTRIDMQATGIRTPVGIKILGPDLGETERIGMEIEGLISGLDGVRSVYSERNLGGLYVDVLPDREKAARYGLGVGDVESAIEDAVGGVEVGVTLDARSRYAINVRYLRDSRDSIEKLREVVVGRASMGGGAGPGGEGPGMGAAPGGMAAMGGPGGSWPDVRGQGLQYVTLGQVADVRISEGPPMIKDEDGMLAGYVYVDVDTSKRDIGGFVDEAKGVLAAKLSMPSGYRLRWTGQYELMEDMQKRMRIAIPLALGIIVLLLYLSMRSVAKILIVLLSLPFSLVGSVWLMHLTGSNLSTATWVGVIAMLGLAAETGILMIVYLDLSYDGMLAQGRIRTRDDVRRAVMEGAVQRVRPKLMTVLTTFIGLVPLLWAEGSGADVMRRLAIPLVGGLATSTFLTLEIIPVVYMWWRSWQLGRVRA